MATPLSGAAMQDLETRLSDYTDAKSQSFPLSQANPFPSFERFNGGAVPIVRESTVATNSLYWPWVVKCSDFGLDVPADEEYRMYYSTDHDSGAGGIGCITSADPTFTPFDDLGVIYTDTVSGSQTETPALIAQPRDPDGKPFYLYYQNKDAAPPYMTQSTVFAKSADGLSGWTRVGTIIDPKIQQPDPGYGVDEWEFYETHTGYFKPYRIGNRWIADHLLSGSPVGKGGMSHSYEGRRWFMDPRPKGGTAYAFDGLGYSSGNDHVFFNGMPWRVGSVGIGGSGIDERDQDLMAWPVSWDFVHVLGPPQMLLDLHTGPSWEVPNYRASFLYLEGGNAYLYYNCWDLSMPAKTGEHVGLAIAGVI